MDKSAVQQYWQKSTYRQKVKARFKQQVQNLVIKHEITTYLVLVVDKSTILTISNLFKIPQLVALKITFIQKLQVIRKKLDYHALYFIMPTMSNIQIMINDFKDKDKPQYKKIHILFPTFVDHSVLKKMAGQKNLFRKIAKNSIKEFYHSSRLVQHNTLNFQVQYMRYCYSRDSDQQLVRRGVFSKKIVEILANIGQLNTVRIYYKRQANRVSERVAQQVARHAKKYLGTLIQNKSFVVNRYTSDVTFLFLDRSVDTVTPLMHNFAYQAMLFDLMKMTFQGKDNLQDKQYYSFQQIDDQVYQQYRYKHISVALQQLPKDLQQLKGKLQKSGEDKVDFKQLDDKLKQVRRHMQFISGLWEKFKSKKMDVIGQIQQSLATGIKQDCSQTSSVALYNQATQLMKQPYLTKTQKIRLGLLILTCIKLSKKDYQQLLKMYSQQDQKALQNIIALGISYDASIGKSTKAVSKQQQNIATKRRNQTGMALDRYTTILQLVVPMVINVLSSKTQQESLDEQLFGTMNVTLFEQDNINFDPKKFVFVMCGGLSFGELAALRSRKQTQDVLIAADHLLSPQSFVKNLEQIDILTK